MLNRLITFCKALYFHIGNGLPKANSAQILYRYQICQLCDRYENKYCLECGCNVNDKSIFLNKLAWADQECPLGKWNKIL